MECGIISENAGTGQNGFVTRSNLRKIVFGWGGGRNTLHCTNMTKWFYAFTKQTKLSELPQEGLGGIIMISKNIVNIVSTSILILQILFSTRKVRARPCRSWTVSGNDIKSKQCTGEKEDTRQDCTEWFILRSFTREGVPPDKDCHHICGNDWGEGDGSFSFSG